MKLNGQLPNESSPTPPPPLNFPPLILRSIGADVTDATALISSTKIAREIKFIIDSRVATFPNPTPTAHTLSPAHWPSLSADVSIFK